MAASSSRHASMQHNAQWATHKTRPRQRIDARNTLLYCTRKDSQAQNVERIRKESPVGHTVRSSGREIRGGYDSQLSRPSSCRRGLSTCTCTLGSIRLQDQVLHAVGYCSRAIPHCATPYLLYERSNHRQCTAFPLSASHPQTAHALLRSPTPLESKL